jgi:predicted RNase H-like HicB family nuclease
MRTVVVKYRKEADGAWIGTSPDVPGYVGHGETFDEARKRVQEGLPWFAEEPDVLIAHVAATYLADSATHSPRISFGITKSTRPRERYSHVISGASAA